MRTKVAIYVRGNTPTEIFNQTLHLMFYAFNKGYEINPQEIYQDKGNEARPFQRPQLSRLLSDTAIPTFDTVIAYSPDRIARDIETLHEVKEILSQNDIKLTFKNSMFEVTV